MTTRTTPIPQGWKDSGSYFAAQAAPGLAAIVMDHLGIDTPGSGGLGPAQARQLAKRLIQAADLYESTYAPSTPEGGQQ